MAVYRIDVMGTVFGHETLLPEEVMAAVRKLCMQGCDARFWSTAIEAIPEDLLFQLREVAPVETKPIMPPRCGGWVIVDDEPMLQRLYRRLGATVLDAVQFVKMIADRT